MTKKHDQRAHKARKLRHFHLNAHHAMLPASAGFFGGMLVHEGGWLREWRRERSAWARSVRERACADPLKEAIEAVEMTETAAHT